MRNAGLDEAQAGIKIPGRHINDFRYADDTTPIQLQASVPSSEYSGLVSFRMDWLDLLAVQGTLKTLLQYHSSKASILRCSSFFTVQLSHPYMTTGKTIALTRWTFVGKVMSLLLNMLSRLVITFLPRSKRLLISWLPSPSAVYNFTKRWCMCIGIADPLCPTIETNTTL